MLILEDSYDIIALRIAHHHSQCAECESLRHALQCQPSAVLTITHYRVFFAIIGEKDAFLIYNETPLFFSNFTNGNNFRFVVFIGYSKSNDVVRIL
jgi:hypothetical protein